MNSRFFQRSGRLIAAMATFVAMPAVGLSQDAGNLGSVSTCPTAPGITSAAVSFVLSPQSGLTLFQANAAILTTVRQACISSPNLAPEIARQAVLAISSGASSAAVRSAALANGTGSEAALASPADAGISATTGYSAAIQSVLRGAIQGCASTGMTTADMKNIFSAICSAIVLESAKQAGVSSVLSQKGPIPVDKSLPMDTVENAVAVIKEVVESFSKTASALGISQVEIAGSINLAGQEAMATAKGINADTVSAEVLLLAAGQMPSQMAVQVAKKVANKVADQIVAQAYQPIVGSQVSGNQTELPYSTVPFASTPGQNLPGPFPNPPVPTPTPFPTPPPTPVPTPTPPSPH